VDGRISGTIPDWAVQGPFSFSATALAGTLLVLQNYTVGREADIAPLGLTCPNLDTQPYRLLECGRRGRGDGA
jgi:hypothetical protein